MSFKHEDKKHHNRSEVKAVKREMVWKLNDLNKSILGLFGLDEGDNIGAMSEPSVKDLDKFLKELNEMRSYYGGLV